MLPRVNLARCNAADYLLFGTNDCISRHLTQTGDWDTNLQALTKLFTAGLEAPFIVDVGANLGAYTVPAAKIAAERGGKVYSFEPQRIIYYQLCGNIFLNQLDNVVAFNLAIGEETKVIEIPVLDYGATHNIGGFSIEEKYRAHTGVDKALSGQTEPVSMVSLDYFSFPKAAAFVKIDVEGYELNVLKGALRFLTESNFPPFYLEVWSNPAFDKEREELFAFVDAMGYEATRVATDDYICQHPANAVRVEFHQEGDQLAMERVR